MTKSFLILLVAGMMMGGRCRGVKCDECKFRFDKEDMQRIENMGWNDTVENIYYCPSHRKPWGRSDSFGNKYEWVPEHWEPIEDEEPAFKLFMSSQSFNTKDWK